MVFILCHTRIYVPYMCHTRIQNKILEFARCRWSSRQTCVRVWPLSTSRWRVAAYRASVSTRCWRLSGPTSTRSAPTYSNCKVTLPAPLNKTSNKAQPHSHSPPITLIDLLKLQGDAPNTPHQDLQQGPTPLSLTPHHPHWPAQTARWRPQHPSPRPPTRPSPTLTHPPSPSLTCSNCKVTPPTPLNRTPNKAQPHPHSPSITLIDLLKLQGDAPNTPHQDLQQGPTPLSLTPHHPHWPAQTARWRPQHPSPRLPTRPNPTLTHPPSPSLTCSNCKVTPPTPLTKTSNKAQPHSHSPPITLIDLLKLQSDAPNTPHQDLQQGPTPLSLTPHHPHWPAQTARWRPQHPSPRLPTRPNPTLTHPPSPSLTCSNCKVTPPTPLTKTSNKAQPHSHSPPITLIDLLKLQGDAPNTPHQDLQQGPTPLSLTPHHPHWPAQTARWRPQHPSPRPPTRPNPTLTHPPSPSLTCSNCKVTPPTPLNRTPNKAQPHPHSPSITLIDLLKLQGDAPNTPHQDLQQGPTPLSLTPHHPHWPAQTARWRPQHPSPRPPTRPNPTLTHPPSPSLTCSNCKVTPPTPLTKTSNKAQPHSHSPPITLIDLLKLQGDAPNTPHQDLQQGPTPLSLTPHHPHWPAQTARWRPQHPSPRPPTRPNPTLTHPPSPSLTCSNCKVTPPTPLTKTSNKAQPHSHSPPSPSLTCSNCKVTPPTPLTKTSNKAQPHSHSPPITLIDLLKLQGDAPNTPHQDLQQGPTPLSLTPHHPHWPAQTARWRPQHPSPRPPTRPNPTLTHPPSPSLTCSNCKVTPPTPLTKTSNKAQPHSHSPPITLIDLLKLQGDAPNTPHQDLQQGPTPTSLTPHHPHWPAQTAR